MVCATVRILLTVTTSEKELPQHELLGETISKKLLYYPAVTREDFPNRGRLTHLIESGAMQKTLGLPIIDPANDRFMLCGNPQMLADLRTLLNARSFNASVRIGSPGDYVFERAFVDQ